MIKRKVVLFLVLVILLTMSGCDKESNENTNVEIENFKYNIERIDASKKSMIQDCDFSMKQYYDLLTIEDENESAIAINKRLNQDYENYKLIFSETDKYFSEKEESIKNGDTLTSDKSEEYVDTVETRVSQNDKNIFSIIYTSQWYMGGVSNSNVTGRVFDYSTGKELTIPQYLDISEEKATEYVHNTVKYEINKDPDSFDENSYDLAKAISAKDISFYVQNDKVYICFETYDIACGAKGNFVFELIMDDNKNADEIDSNDKDNDSKVSKSNNNTKTADSVNKNTWYFALEKDVYNSLGIKLCDTYGNICDKLETRIKYETDIIRDEDCMDGPFESFKICLDDGTELYFQKQCAFEDDFENCFYLVGIRTENKNISFGRNFKVGMTENDIRSNIPDFSDSGSYCMAKEVSNRIDNDYVNEAIGEGYDIFFSSCKQNNIITLDCGAEGTDWGLYTMTFLLDKNKTVSKIKFYSDYIAYPDFYDDEN